MKTTRFYLLMLFTVVVLIFVPNSFAQVGSPEYVVRVVYFLPSDRTPQPDINAKLDRLIKNTQFFFAEQMTAHGFSQKTFEFEADAAGKLVVHRVNGQFNDAYYNSDAWDKVWNETNSRFDLSNNIWLVALDVSTEVIDNAWCGLGGGSSLQGFALIPASGGCFNVSVTGHELGHAFGLMHDNRTSGRWIPSVYSSDRMITSFCSAEWLDIHRYFRRNQPLSNATPPTIEMLAPDLSAPFSAPAPQEMGHLCGVGELDVQHDFKVNQTAPGDTWPTVEMLGPPSLVAAPNTIRLRFKVTDANGLHQVRLHTPEWDPYVAGGFIACQRVSGTTATVAFVTTELSSKNESVTLSVIDVHGNFFWSVAYPIDVSSVLPPATAVSMPDARLAAAVRQKIGSITTRSLLNLRALDAKDYTGIADLTGLEHAYNLKYLNNVYNGEITDIHPLANLKGLANLDLREHQISDITALRNLTNLSVILIWKNQISDITALRNLTNLTWLGIDNNNISDITALRNLTNLDGLGLGGNQISNITALRNLTNLRTMLAMWNNNISDITAVGNLTNLEGLYLSGNQISDITAVRNLTQLVGLHLDFNQIRDITALRNLTNLTSLRLTHNQIADVRPLVGLVNLEELYLAGNPIEDLSPLRTLLANNPNVKIDIDIPFGFSTNSIADQTFTVGEAVNLTLPIAAGGTPPYTYTLTPLPGGLSFNATERELSGTPTTAGMTNTTYTATDAANVSDSLTFTIEVTAGVPLDVDGDGQVTVIDLAIVALFYGTQGPTDTRLPADVNADGIVNILDLTAVAQGIDAAGGNIGVLSLKDVEAVLVAGAEQVAALEDVAAAPMGFSTRSDILSSGTAYVNVTHAYTDAKHLPISDVLSAFLELLTELGAIPDTTALLPNYPNPFNPETWIPYHLATEAAVKVTIYDVRGSLVRTLMLGHQPAGVYESRGRAAHWDGRNQHGEHVASGLYFYTLTAGDFTATRKLLIAK